MCAAQSPTILPNHIPCQAQIPIQNFLIFSRNIQGIIFIHQREIISKVYICIWSDQNAAEMVKFYKSVLKDTKVGKYSYWGKNPMGVKEGSVLTVHLYILGQKIMLLNGYTQMSFNESISMVVPCKTQREIDTYWKKLSSNGGRPVQCGWVIDKFGVRWQIAPTQFDQWNTSKNKKKKEVMMFEMWKMIKLDIKKLQAAFDNA